MADRIRVGITGHGMMGTTMMGVLGALQIPTTGLFGLNNEDIAKLREDPKYARVPLELSGNFDLYNQVMANSVDLPFNAVNICSPNFLHIPQATAAALRGLHVLSEKPLAMSLEEIAEFTRIADEKNIAFAVDSHYRKHELLDKTMRGLLRQEEIKDKYLEAVIEKVTGQKTLGRALEKVDKYFQGWMFGAKWPISWRPEVAIAGYGKLVRDLGVHDLTTNMDIHNAKIEQFQGQTYRLHDTRWKYKGPPLPSFTSPDAIPGPDKEPGNWEEMDMTGTKYSGDDKAVATYILNSKDGYKIPVTVELSQVEEGLHDPFGNDFSMEWKFENAYVKFNVWEPDKLYITSLDRRKTEVYRRHSDPGIIGAPGRHVHANTAGMLYLAEEWAEAIENAEKRADLRRRELGFAKDAEVLQEAWMEPKILPIADYQPPKMPVLEKAG